jgi:hypothetical protein
MAWIATVRVSRADAMWIIESLRSTGRADDVTAAHAIERAMKQLAPVDDLTPAECNAVLTCLEDPPSSLAQLHGTLARRHADRSNPHTPDA